jgi:hypothetical protein
MSKTAEVTHSLIEPPGPAIPDGSERGPAFGTESGAHASDAKQSEPADAEPRPSADQLRSAIGFLRGEDNPFDMFVAAQSADDDFFCFHAPEIHDEAQAKIRRAIEKYSEPNFRSRHQLHPTRALLVRGVRGAGKTHLLHAIQFRDDGLHDLLVRPRYFEKQYPFAEYVLKEVVRTLLGGDGPEVPNPIGWAAGRITRRLLLEAVLALNPQEWLQRTARPGGLGVLLGRRWKKQQARQDELVRDLDEDRADQSAASICGRHRLEIETAKAIVSDHVARCEQGTRPLVAMRRRLLLAMFELGLNGGVEPIATFLDSGFAEPGAGLANTRAALVDDLLRAVVEVLAAVGVPVVLAFDNIERLLAPTGRLDAQVAQALFSGLAQLIDAVPGILVLLFVEDGLWIQCTQQAIDSFARDRLLLGIRMRDHGHVAELQLGPPSYHAIEAMVRRRMAPLRARIGGSDGLPSLFPFESSDLRAVAGHSSDVLRAALLRLRDRYDEIVLSTSSGHATIPGQDSLAAKPDHVPDAVPVEQLTQLQVDREVLQPRWDNAVARAARRLESAPHGSLAGELHAGFSRWLGAIADQAGSLGPIHVDGVDWSLTGVDSGITFGDHPTFGLLTVGHWRRVSDGDVHRVGIGLVLAARSGMPRDLAVKLSAVKVRPAVADQFVVLWPARDTEFEPSDLPTGSRKVWDEQAPVGVVRLHGLPTGDIAWLLAFNEWVNETSELARPGWPDGAVRQFFLPRTRPLLERLVPRPKPEGNAG